MPADKIDTQFLKGTVAAVLVRACAECAVSRPEDPVEFVSVRALRVHPSSSPG
jgi:hypothetical protein